jgi:hypothetical protein
MVEGGYSRTRAFEHVAQIGSTIAQILARAEAEKLPTHVIADRMAEERVEARAAVRRGEGNGLTAHAAPADRFSAQVR